MTEAMRGKVALITGASSGIGRAMARLLAAEGANLGLVARNAERIEALRRELGPTSLAVPTDLARPEGVERAVDQVLSHFGHIDILIANAGLYVPGRVAEGDPDAWDEMLAVNVNSVFRLVRRVLPAMIARNAGDILFTSSIAGHENLSMEPVYGASKHAVQAFAHAVRRQAAPHNVRVGSIAPGTVLNELWGITNPEEIDRRVALREGLRSEDVAEACLWMLTRSQHMTVRDLVLLPQRQDI
jgi:ribitol 2-dehydrogenase